MMMKIFLGIIIYLQVFLYKKTKNVRLEHIMDNFLIFVKIFPNSKITTCDLDNKNFFFKILTTEY